MNRPTIYAILPASGAKPENIVRSLQSLRRSTCRIAYVHRSDEEAPIGPDVKPVECNGSTVGDFLNAGIENSEADLYLWIPPGLRILKNTLRIIEESFINNPQASLFTADYLIEKTETRIFPLRDDLTEREDFGMAWAVPAWALKEIGQTDHRLKYSTFYDLRLKLAEVGTVEHIKTPIYQVNQVEEDNESSADNLYYPGKGRFGGFSYLFMDKEEEEEIEQVLLNCLKRRNAYLEGKTKTVIPSPLAPDDPIVTVVIPVHNRARFLPMAIDSVLQGRLQNFEIIIVDNASTDSTREVAEEYVKKDPRIRLLTSEVNIIAKALNMGIHEARGRYIAQLDSDDEYLPDTLQSMVNHFLDHPRCGLAISYYELIDEAGNSLEEFGIIKHLEYNQNNILRVDGAGALRMWHKSVILELGGFNETDFPNYGEDYDLVLKVGELYDVDRVHEVLYRYRRHPGNTDALRRQEDKITAKTLARTRAIKRRQELNKKSKA